MITYYNVQTDTDHPFSEKYHFDSETFLDGKALIIKGLEDITAYMKKQNFEDARKRLGQILHTLQVSPMQSCDQYDFQLNLRDKD